MAASPTVTVSGLDAGQITLPEHMFVTDADPEKRNLVPSLSFLIRHAEPDGSITNLVFDLGVKRDLKYTPAQQNELDTWQPINTDTDCAQSLRNGVADAVKTAADASKTNGILLNPAKDVDYIIISHAHWDHTGTPSDFPSATFAVGSGTLNLFKHGAGPAYPADLFNDDELPAVRTIEFPPITRTAASWAWKPFGELPHTLDFFGDGSLYVVDTPGHIYGHVNLLARLGERRFVYLAGDCCHDRRLVTGEKDIGLYDDGHGGLRSIHTDTEEAKKSLERVREFVKKKGDEGVEVEVVLAHDPIWRRENAHKCWPGKM
ncbi:beta-lactamase-like protein [Trichoderma gracile]